MRGLAGLNDIASFETALWGGLGLTSLFANGENGFLFGDFSDLSRQFLLSTGGTNVAANNDPVGLLLDNSQWGGKTLAQTLAAQPDLYAFDGTSLDGWRDGVGTASIVDGRFRITSDDSGSAGRMTYPITCEIGKSYALVSERFTGTSAPSVVIALSAGAFGTNVGVIDGPGSEVLIFVATQTTHYLTLVSNGAIDGVYAEFDDISLKELPGNHGLQATGTKRPLWQGNSGKPYLAPDGSDDALVTPFIPTANLTMALACRITNASTIMIGGGTTVDDKRAYIGLSTSGQLNIGWGKSQLDPAGTDRRGQDMIVIVTGDDTGRDVWIDGVKMTIPAASGAPDGTGGGIALGAFNAAGTPANFASGRISAALALDRRVTPTEIALITRKFMETYQ